jgi:hypothetical protein
MKKALPNLPTWVPDWTGATNGLQFQRVSKFGYCASGDSEAVIQISEHTPSIFVHGALVDSIVEIGLLQTHESPDLQPLNTEEFLQNYIPWTLCSWELINRSDLFTSLAPQTRLEMFSRLVSADSPNVKHPLDPYARTFNQFYSVVSPKPESPNPFESEQCSDEHHPATEEECRSFTQISSLATKARKVCITSKGYIGLVPDLAEVEDEICVFLGARAPFILRNVGEAHGVVGDAFILNMMKGEALRMNDFVSSLICLRYSSRSHSCTLDIQ